MLKAFKTEINPTLDQKIRIHKTIGTCRFIYNFFIAHNKERHEKGEKYINAKQFSVWLNNVFLPENPDHFWIKEVSSKSVKNSMENAHMAFQKFFAQKAGFPKFKKKARSDVKMYFVKTDKKAVIRCERHRICIPTLGWVRIKEKGYIPVTRSGLVIRSGTVSMQAGRYYVSVLIDVPSEKAEQGSDQKNEGIGIDLGIKSLAVVSDGRTYENINRSAEVRRLEKKLRREQRCLSRKYENQKKGKTQRKNIQKQVLKVQRIHQKLDQIRTDYINKTICEIVRTKPSYITIEDLNVSGMMKNRHLSKAVASQKLYEFRKKLEGACRQNGIALRIVDRWYPSSKRCHVCGNIKRDLKLSDRMYRCGCGYEEDRDLNASLNLRDAESYILI